MFCKECLLQLGRGLGKDDLRVIEALHNNGALNKESVSQVTRLTTSKLRDSLSRLKGALMIEESRIGEINGFPNICWIGQSSRLAQNVGTRSISLPSMAAKMRSVGSIMFIAPYEK